MALDINTIEQVDAALAKAPSSGNSEFVERLNICAIALGTYQLSQEDLDDFKNSSSDGFIAFYKRWLYRTPDGVVENGSGIIHALCKILEALDQYRRDKNITQEYADDVARELEDKRKQLELQETVKSEIDRLNTELAGLISQLDELDSHIKKLEELKVQKQNYDKLIRIKNEILSNDGIGKLNSELEHLKVEFNKDLSLEIAIKMARLFTVAEVFSKIDLDLFCEYIEDKIISDEIKKSNRIQNEDMSKLKNNETHIEKILCEYKELLKKILLDLSP